MSNDKVQSIMALVDGYALAFTNVCQADEATVRECIEKKDAAATALESAIREAIAAPGVAQGWKPISDEQIDAETFKHWYYDAIDFKAGVRFAEKCHGITAEQERPPYCGSGHCSCIECPYGSIKGGPAE